MLDLEQATTRCPTTNLAESTEGSDQSIWVMVEQHHLSAFFVGESVIQGEVRCEPKCPTVLKDFSLQSAKHMSMPWFDIQDLDPMRYVPGAVRVAVPRRWQFRIFSSMRVRVINHFPAPTFALPPQGGRSPQATVGECRGWNRQAEAWRRCHDLHSNVLATPDIKCKTHFFDLTFSFTLLTFIRGDEWGI